MAAFRARLTESARAFGDVFENPNLRRIQLALLGSNLGAWAYIVAIAVYAYDQGGARAVGLVALARWGIAALVQPWAGVIADRYPRRLVMVCSDAARAGALALAAAVALTGGPAMLVYAMTVLAAVANTPFRPAEAALLPSLARTPEELTASNVASNVNDSVMMFAGPGIGGVVLAASSPGVVFAATAGTLVWSSLLVVGVRPPARASGEEPAEREPIGAALAKGFATVLRAPRVLLLIGLFLAQTLVGGALTVLTVVLALRMTGLGAAGVGWLNAALGIGGVLGAMVAAGLVGRKRLASDFGIGIVLWGLPLAAVAAFPRASLALVLFGVVGIGNTLVDVSGLTLLQRSAPEEVLGRVFGVLETVTGIGFAAGAALAPALVAALGDRWAFAVSGMLLPALALLAWRRLVAIDAEAVVPERQLALLRAIPMFAALPGPTLERLAAGLRRVDVPAGEIVLRQGDVGDRFYVVGAGHAAVEVDGRPAPDLGPGDHFGEIALLRDVPRTATVRALEPLELHALERDDFIGAVTGHAPSMEAAETVVGARLASAAILP